MPRLAIVVPSGVSLTEMPINKPRVNSEDPLKRKASVQLCFVRPLIKNTSGTMTSMKRIISQVKRLTPLSNAVSACGSTSMRAMPPR